MFKETLETLNVKDGIVKAPDEGCVKRYDVGVENNIVYIIKS